MIVAGCLAGVKALPVGTISDVTGDEPFLVLSPHADDETLGCGGLLALTAGDAGAGHVMILTDGAGSHPGSRDYPRERLVALRRTESAAAVAVLGLPEKHLTFFDMPDTALPSHGPGFDEAVVTVVTTAKAIGAGSLLVTWSHDPHCDHEAAAAIARAAAGALDSVRLWAYPIWAWHLDPAGRIEAELPTGWRLDISEVRGAKRRALACYRSQMTPLIDDDPDGFSFTQAQLEPFLGGFEYFLEMA